MPHSQDPETTFQLPSDLDIVTTHMLPAQSNLVFQAYTNPAIISQWWGRKSKKTVVEKLELKPGGAWRFLQYDEVGNETGFHGEFHTIQDMELLSYTMEWEAFPDIHGFETIEFKQVDHKTKVKGTTHFNSFEDREKILQTGFENALRESMERLTEILEKRELL